MRVEISRQKSFVIEGESLEIPLNIKEIYPQVAEFLSKQPLWQEAKKGKNQALLVDTKKQQGFIFNPHNWQMEKDFSLDSLELPINSAGIIIVSPPLSLNPQQLQEILTSTTPFLPEKAAVFVFESKNCEFEKNKRKKILQESGLVKITFLSSFDSFWIWRARTAKKRKLSRPINLLDGGPFWRQNWINKLMREMRENYQKAGFLVIDDSELEECLRNSYFPLWDVRRIELGFGVVIKSPCGCRWSIDKNGVETRIWQCESGCPGVPENKTFLQTKEVNNKMTTELKSLLKEILERLGITDPQKDIIPSTGLNQLHLLFGPKWKEEDLGKIINQPCGCQYMVLRVQLPDPESFKANFPEKPWSTKPTIAAVRIKTCKKHRLPI